MVPLLSELMLESRAETIPESKNKRKQIEIAKVVGAFVFCYVFFYHTMDITIA